MSSQEEENKQEQDSDNQSEGYVESEEHQMFNQEDLQCRFYRHEFPEKDDIVAVRINKITDDSTEVSLLEYNDMDGLILSKFVHKNMRIKVRSILKVGDTQYMQVMDCNEDTQEVDLSKKSVQKDDRIAHQKFFKKSQMVHLIMRLTAVTLGTKVITCYENFGWDFYDHFDHALNGFKLALQEPEMVFEKIKDISDAEKEALLKNITKKMASAPVKMRTKFNLTCYTYEGVEAIKQTMIEAKRQTSDDDFKLEFAVDAAPLYQAEVVHLDKHRAIERLQQALDIMQNEIKARGGMFKIITPPTIVGARGNDVDNEDIINQMNRIGEENDSDDMGDFDENDGILMEEDGQEEQKIQPKAQKK